MLGHFQSLQKSHSGLDRSAVNDTVIPPLGETTFKYHETFLAYGLNAMTVISQIITNPKTQDWLQLILLGIAAEVTRRFSRHLLVWARKTLCITSVHTANDDSYNWLMCR